MRVDVVCDDDGGGVDEDAMIETILTSNMKVRERERHHNHSLIVTIYIGLI